MSVKGSIIRLLPERVYLEYLHQRFKLTNSDSFKSSQEQRKIITNDGYSLKPFDDSKSIFIHIPKCAGVSVSKALYGNLAGGHATLDMYLSIFEPKLVQSYFKFTIVRNPWDRVVSAYHFLKKGGMNDADRRWADKELKGLDSFDVFVKEWLTPDNIWKYHHFRPQYFYMLDRRRKILIDFVGFLENIENDYQHIADHLNATEKLTVSNKGERASYMSYYNTQTAEIVRQVYAADIQILRYDYDNSSLDKQIAARDRGRLFNIP